MCIKSTLLKVVSGDLTPSRGRVVVDGTVGTLRQMVQVSPHETVAELMGASAGLELLRKAEAGAADELSR